MTATSRHLSRRQMRGVDKLGDVLMPGDAELPSFSTLGCAADIDAVLDPMPASDLKDLRLLLTLLGWAPMFLVRGFVGLLERSGSLPGPVGALLRFARIGVRGLVMSLYWSHPRALDAIGYDVSVYTADLAANTASPKVS